MGRIEGDGSMFLAFVWGERWERCPFSLGLGTMIKRRIDSLVRRLDGDRRGGSPFCQGKEGEEQAEGMHYDALSIALDYATATKQI